MKKNAKIKDAQLKELAEIYNTTGKSELYKTLKNGYNMKNPSCVFKRMKMHPELSYDIEKDQFSFSKKENEENIFMSMDELCSPMVTKHASSFDKEEPDSRPAAMDKLVRELIGDRLLELSKYVTIDSLSRRVIIDENSLNLDGYELVIY